MAKASANADLVDRFDSFYRNYYDGDIGELAQRYPNEQRSLYVDYDDLYRFDVDLAEDYRTQPEQMREYAEEALRQFDLPADVKLGRAHVRLHNLPDPVDIRDIRVHDDHIGRLVKVRGIVRKATDVRPKVVEAAFECQRCGTMTYIPQRDGSFQEPHECQGCERQGPFRVNHDQSEFVDSQQIRVQESPEGLRGGETPQHIDVNLEDDVTGMVTAGDHVSITGVLHIEQMEQGSEKSAVFDLYMDGVAVEIEDEEFEDMEITPEDVEEILALSQEPEVHELMIDSIAPTIYGYREEKFAMVLQLFSGVTKHLPDRSRIRGDMHLLLIGDPGTGKSQLLSYIRKVAPRSVYTSGKGSSAAGLCVTGDTLIHTTDGFRPIRDLAEPHHPDPVEVDEAAPAAHDVYTLDREQGAVETRSSSRVWRMPEKPCRRIETAHGKRVEASVNTPVLVRGEDGTAWRDVADVDPGDHVAVPKYDDVERSSPSPRDFLAFGAEKLKPTDESVDLLRDRLCAEFGTLRDAAAALDLAEDLVDDTCSNRHVPREQLDNVLDATGLDVADIDVDRAMLRHGDSVSIPDEFDDDLLYLVGLAFGGGDISVSRRGENRGHVRISNADERLLREAAAIIEETFDRSVEIERQDGRVPCVRLDSATVARFFENLGMTAPKHDLALDPRLTTADGADAFLRGLFDADGSVCVRDDGGPSVQLSTVGDELGRQVQLMLETYGVRARRRDASGRADGHEVESRSVQTHLAVDGEDVDRFADRVGFRSAAKSAALSRLVDDTPPRGEGLPPGDAVVRPDGAGQPGDFHTNPVRGDDPGRERVRAVRDDRDLGDATADADLAWDEVVSADDIGEREVFDLTVPETHNFVADGVVTHNTAAAVRDDFGDGQQWTLEAGALVLADKGIAAVDELDKMNPDDRSAMHQALEQQEISVSKAGINATLKSRCSLLGAANPRYGRFDPYEPIAEQIDLEPALVSRFDLIFTVQDKPDPEKDADLADHILNANYAGELATQRERMTNPEFDDAEIEAVTADVEPAIDPALMRKYIAYARRECFPSMTEAARERIKEFYVEMREKGTDEDAPVPITARKLEALVRLAEATARVRLSDEVTEADATRVVELVRSCLENIGVDPETGEFDADVVETGTSKSQRDRIKSVKALIEEVESDYDGGAPFEEVLDRADEVGMDRAKVEQEIENLKQKGEVYEPSLDSLRTT